MSKAVAEKLATIWGVSLPIDAAEVIMLELQAAYAAGVATEREACALMCETEAANPSCLWEEPGCWAHAAENCAAAIRARGQA